MERYQVGKLLGKGAYGEVFLAVRKADGERVAIKSMLPVESNIEGVSVVCGVAYDVAWRGAHVSQYFY